MEPILTSKVREKIRRDNENRAKAEATRIQQSLNQELDQFEKKLPPLSQNYIAGGCGLGFIFGVILGISNKSFSIFWLVFLLLSLAGFGVWRWAVHSTVLFNKNIDDQVEKLKQDAQASIKYIYEKADEKTNLEIKSYEKEVEHYFRKMKGNKESLKKLVDFACDLFDKALSEAVTRSSTSERFVSFVFAYLVSIHQIEFSSSIDTSEIFDFKQQRYKSLKDDAECEALAAALMKSIGGYVLKQYNQTQCQLKFRNNDSYVELTFEMPNKSFIPATVLY